MHKVSLLFSALYAKCPCYFVLYMQSVLVIKCFICKVSLLFSALYAKRPDYVVLYMQREGEGGEACGLNKAAQAQGPLAPRVGGRPASPAPRSAVPPTARQAAGHSPPRSSATPEC